MKLVFWLIVFAIVSFLACTKCHNTTYNLAQEQLDFSNFKEGSYWIMRDSLTGRRDSFVASLIFTGETHTYTTKHCFDANQYKVVRIYEYNGTTNTKVAVYWSLEFQANKTQALDYTFDEKANYQTLNYSRFSLSGDYSNVIINGQSYDSVSITENSFNYQNRCQLYINRRNILLKVAVKNEYEQKVWELEKANVIR